MKKTHAALLYIIIGILNLLALTGCAMEPEEPSVVLERTEKQPLIETEEPAEIFQAVDEAEVADHFYYAQLSEEQQLIYRQLIDGIERYDTGISVNADSIEDVDLVLNEVLKDCPEYFWIGQENSSNGMINDIGNAYSFVPLYNTEIADIDYIRYQIDNSVDHFISSLPVEADTYSKVKSAYEWVILNTSYVEDCAHSQNILSVFLEKESVCAGYARSFQYLMDRLDIPCIYVEGDAGEPAEPHAWNMVNIDGIYYYVDCTWGDQSYVDESTGEVVEELSYDYLCLLTEEISRTHMAVEGYEYPICDNIQYDYHNMNGSYFESYEEGTLSQFCYTSVTSGETDTYFKFQTEETYSLAKAAIEEGSVLDDAAYYMLDITGVDEYWYSYYYNDDLYTITITW